jgi:16S rRNA processing protein RimM
MTQPPEDLIAVGRVVDSWGREGLLKITPITSFPEKLPDKREVWLWRDDFGAKKYDVRGGRFDGRHVLLGLEEVADTSGAKSLKGSLVMVDHENLESLPEGTYYQHQIIGLTVRKEDGTELGTITEILPTGAVDVYIIKKEDGEVMLPAAREFIVRIDLDSGVMVVRPPDGLEETG